jgi:prepilin-type N-terminal cleavage/methylation domain-containing protein
MARGDVMARPTQPRNQRRIQRGFTLLELLITLSVTTIGLIGLLSLHLSVARGNDTASRAAEAQQLAVTELESLRSMRITALLTELGPVPDFPTPQRVQLITGRGNITFRLVSQAERPVAGIPSLIRIRVVAGWAEGGGDVGSNAGAFDHSLALEVLKTMEETL